MFATSRYCDEFDPVDVIAAEGLLAIVQSGVLAKIMEPMWEWAATRYQV